MIIYHVVFLHIDPEKEETVAEDEEYCNEEYINKGLVPRTVNMQCISPIHNAKTPAIRNYPTNIPTWWKERHWQLHLQVIPKGTITQTLATKCDGHKECWQGKDEDCDDLDPGVTVLIGTSLGPFI